MKQRLYDTVGDSIHLKFAWY